MISLDEISFEFADLLWNAGWDSSRKVSVFLWMEQLQKEGLIPTPAATAILESLGGIRLHLPAAGISPYWHEVLFDPVYAASGDADRVEPWVESLGLQFFPIGEEVTNNNVIWSGSDGQFYLGREFGLYFLGHSFRAAMDELAFPSGAIKRVAES